MSVRYESPRVEVEDSGARLRLRFQARNESRHCWRREDGFAMGWQLYDPASGRFLSEGEWVAPGRDVEPRETLEVELAIALPAERGRYRVYVSPRDEPGGWRYLHGWKLLVVDASRHEDGAAVERVEPLTLGQLRRRAWAPALRRLAAGPFEMLWRNAGLIRSMVRRDLLARYRGSFGGAAWTVLHPLLLMATYFFVFGVVLQARFAGDPSRAGFALYFLAGILPWLAFSEPAGRAPHVILEHRNFVKKMVFPVETLPVNLALGGLVTQAFAAALFVLALAAARGAVPLTVLWLPLLVLPQLLFTLGLCWFLAALGVFVRDLGQIMSFLLTLWFFLTPICYPETSLPEWAVPVLRKNPLFVLARGFRDVLLEGHAPNLYALAKLYVVSGLVFLLGYAWFARLRRTFADAI